MPTAEKPAAGRRRAPNRTDWWMTGLLAVAFAASIGGLQVLLIGGEWYAPVLALALLPLLLAAVARASGVPLWVPPVVSLVGVVAALTAFFAPLTGYLLVIPSAETGAEFGELLAIAGRSIESQSVPANPNLPIVFVLAIGVAGAAILADLLANGWRAPALAGAPLVVILAAPGFIAAGLSDPLPFVIAAICYLAMLRVGSPPDQKRLSVAIGAVALLAALVLPTVLPPVAPQGGEGGPGVAAGVNPVLSLGEDLRQTQEVTVLEYSTRSEGPEYLRLTTVDDFEGADWAPSRAQPGERNTLDEIAGPPGVDDGVATRAQRSDIRVLGLGSSWLPMPYPPTSASGADDSWRWSRTDLSVSSQVRSAAGEEYRVESLVLDPTPEQLALAGSSTPQAMMPFLEVPAGLAPSVATIAKAAVAGADSDYAKAVALQDYFRYGDFDYSETAPVDEGYDGTGVGVIGTFLEEKSGYCIHFASAMAVMARTVDIPSRIAVGFLPGSRIPGEEPSRYQVSNRDLHAWPELYFDGLGWLRFEPTVSRGELPGYAEPSSVDASALPAETAPTPSATPAPTPGATAPAESTVPGTEAEASPPPVWIWPLLVLLLALLVAATPALVRVVVRARRRARLRRGLAPPTLAWLELLQSAEDLGIDVPPTLTPAEVGAVLLPGGRSTALDRIVDAVERESYSRAGAVAEPSIVADLDAAIADLGAAASRARRVRAAVLPTSIWSSLPIVSGR